MLSLTLGVPTPAPKAFTTTSACGACGKDSIDSVRTTSSYDHTGGAHAAGLFTYDGEPLAVREDVGRHNAVDKVIGWAAMNGRVPLRGTVLQVSGRASFEIVQKAAMAGVPMLGAVSAPSSLAVDLAQEAGMTLVGFMRETSMNVYTNGQRLGV